MYSQDLPSIPSLRAITQSLAMLDAIFCPEWQYRYYSFNCSWATGAQILEGGASTMQFWLLVFALLITLVAVAFSVQHTSAAREKWFENQALMEQHGVVAEAVIVAKACAGRTVRYSWKWGEKQLQGGGWSCNSTCSDAKLGEKAQIRFVPTNPGDVRCAQNDIETKIGPPNYFDPILIVILIVALLFVPFIRLSMSQDGQE